MRTGQHVYTIKEFIPGRLLCSILLNYDAIDILFIFSPLKVSYHYPYRYILNRQSIEESRVTK